MSDKQLATAFQGNSTSLPPTLQKLHQNSPPKQKSLLSHASFRHWTSNSWFCSWENIPPSNAQFLTLNTFSMPRIFFSLALMFSYRDVSSSSLDPELATLITLEAALGPTWISSCIFSISASVWTRVKILTVQYSATWASFTEIDKKDFFHYCTWLQNYLGFKFSN